MTRPITQRLAQLATAGAVTAFAASLARHHPDPSTAAESAFMTLVLGFTLTALALSRRTAPVLVPGGALIALTLCLPAADGTRGAVLMALLVSTTVFATWRTFSASGRLAFLDLAALTIAWQCLLRNERLLEWEWSPGAAVWLVALPLTAAAAAWWYHRRHRRAQTLVLLAAMGILGPGFGVVPVAVMVSAAALTGERGRSWQAAAVAAAACVVAIGWQLGVAAPLLVFTAVLALRRPAPSALDLDTLDLDTLDPGTLDFGALDLDAWRLAVWLPVAGALAWALVTIVTTGGSVGALGWLFLVVPLSLLAPAARRPLALAAVALALVHRPETAPSLLAPALALATLALPAERSSRRLQALWSLVLLALFAVGVAYPWLRGSLTEQIPGSGMPVLMFGLAAALLGYGAVWAASRWRPTTLWRVAVTALGLLALAAASRQPRRLVGDPILLTADRDSWETTAGAKPVRSVTVDSFLSGSETLRHGQPVTRLLLTTDAGRPRQLDLRYGLETADWAARRLERPQTPAPWISWHAGDGSLAQRYRSRWEFASPVVVNRIELVRDEGLAREVEVAVLSVATR